MDESLLSACRCSVDVASVFVESDLSAECSSGEMSGVFAAGLGDDAVCTTDVVCGTSGVSGLSMASNSLEYVFEFIEVRGEWSADSSSASDEVRGSAECSSGDTCTADLFE